MLIKEILNKKVEYEVLRASKSAFVTVAKIGKRSIKFSASVVDGMEPDTWDIEFAEYDFKNNVSGTYAITNSGNELEVFSMVKDSILELISRYSPQVIMFSAEKDNGSNKRGNTYERLIKRFKVPGYTYKRGNHEHDSVKYDSFEFVKD